MTLRAIDPEPFEDKSVRQAPIAGTRPRLEWIAISRLRVDESYQRVIARRGAVNIKQIAAAFDWSKFAPVVVAEVEGGLYAIIDGQHRTTAAALRRIGEVPCQIVEADYREQARAFAAINAQVTAITPMQMHYARLAAGDGGAEALSQVCKDAGVSICRYPVPANKMKVGETLAAGQLHKMLTRYGADTLRTALRCITLTRRGNAGMVRAPLVAAICTVLDAEPQFREDEKALIFAMQTFDFSARWEDAGKKAFSERCGMASILVDMIADHLEARMGANAA